MATNFDPGDHASNDFVHYDNASALTVMQDRMYELSGASASAHAGTLGDECTEDSNPDDEYNKMRKSMPLPAHQVSRQEKQDDFVGSLHSNGRGYHGDHLIDPNTCIAQHPVRHESYMNSQNIYVGSEVAYERIALPDLYRRNYADIGEDDGISQRDLLAILNSPLSTNHPDSDERKYSSLSAPTSSFSFAFESETASANPPAVDVPYPSRWRSDSQESYVDFGDMLRDINPLNFLSTVSMPIGDVVAKHFSLEPGENGSYVFTNAGSLASIGVQVGDVLLEVDFQPVSSKFHDLAAATQVVSLASQELVVRRDTNTPFDSSIPYTVSREDLCFLASDDDGGVLPAEFGSDFLDDSKSCAKRKRDTESNWWTDQKAPRAVGICVRTNCEMPAKLDEPYCVMHANLARRQAIASRFINRAAGSKNESQIVVKQESPSNAIATVNDDSKGNKGNEGRKQLGGSSKACAAHKISHCNAELCRKFEKGIGDCKKQSGGRRCVYEGCVKTIQGSSGFCIGHGGGRKCSAESCTRHAVSGGLCRQHGGGKMCMREGCVHFAHGATPLCKRHGGGRRCHVEGCTRSAVSAIPHPLCVRHGGGRRCVHEGCTKSAVGKSSFCVGHGGGNRCSSEGCTNAAIGPTQLCKAHGGGRRCKHPDGCTKSAEDLQDRCKAHGGGKRCCVENCTRSARGSTAYCVGHGGGKRCMSDGCTKAAQGSSSFCVAHGGGRRCKVDGCDKLDQGGGFCKSHGGGKRCKEIGCLDRARGNAVYCLAHGGLQRSKEVLAKRLISSSTPPIKKETTQPASA